jgi:hypothetical protein
MFTFCGISTWVQVAAFWSWTIILSMSLLLAFSASASTAAAFFLSKWAASYTKILKQQVTQSYANTYWRKYFLGNK